MVGLRRAWDPEDLQAKQLLEANEKLPYIYFIVMTQMEIGWDQLLMGRFSHCWSKAFELSTTNPGVPGDRWIKGIITIIWHFILHLQEVQNTNDKGGMEPSTKDLEQRRVLKAKIQALYTRKERIPIPNRHIFDQPIEELSAKPTYIIRDWIAKTTRHVQKLMPI